MKKGARDEDGLKLNVADYHKKLVDQGHDPEWKIHHRPGQEPEAEGECQHCGASMVVGPTHSSSRSTGKNLRDTGPCSGPDTRWQHEMLAEHRQNKAQGIVSDFGSRVKDERDKAWVREQGMAPPEVQGSPKGRDKGWFSSKASLKEASARLNDQMNEALGKSKEEDYHYVRNPMSSAEHGDFGEQYGQHIEPRGRYITERGSGDHVPEGWETGSVHFHNPKHMDFGGGYLEPSNWKHQLSAEHGGKTGQELSDSVRASGHDGIITHDKYGTSEIVDLTGHHHGSGESEVAKREGVTSTTWHGGDVPADWEKHSDDGGHFHEPIHRGMRVFLDAETHDAVHDESRPMTDRAHTLLDHLGNQGRGLGVHWTDSERHAHNVAGSGGWRGSYRAEPRDDNPWGTHTDVVIHAAPPHVDHIEKDPRVLRANNTTRYNDFTDEGEVPLQKGAPVHVTGVSWNTGDRAHNSNWVQHHFDQGQHHTATDDTGLRVNATAGIHGVDLTGHHHGSGESEMTTPSDGAHRLQHTAPDSDYGAPAHELTGNGIFREDIYTHPHYYDTRHEDYSRVHSTLSGLRGNPDKQLKIYRSVPAEHAHKGFQPGDWVSTSKQYARDHGTHRDDSKHDWPVISTMVPAKHIHSEGDIMEWGYNGPAKGGMVSFKGGHHQEITQLANGGIRPVRRKENPLKGYSFLHDPNAHQVHAFGPDENYVGHAQHDETGAITELHVEPEHAHLPIEQKMRKTIDKHMKETGQPDVPPNGEEHIAQAGKHLDLYHYTTPGRAEAIYREGHLDAPMTYWSDQLPGDYGPGVVHIQVPTRVAELAAELGNGERRYRIQSGDLASHHFVSEEAM